VLVLWQDHFEEIMTRIGSGVNILILLSYLGTLCSRRNKAKMQEKLLVPLKKSGITIYESELSEVWGKECRVPVRKLETGHLSGER